MTDGIPAGFAPHFRKSGLTDPWEPIFSRREGDALYLGLRAGPAHANSRGFVHGALIAAFADNAMGLSCALYSDPPGAMVTVSLSVDFLATARMGEWLEIRPSVLKRGGALSFCTATIHSADRLCARANATFRTVKPEKIAAAE